MNTFIYLFTLTQKIQTHKQPEIEHVTSRYKYQFFLVSLCDLMHKLNWWTNQGCLKNEVAQKGCYNCVITLILYKWLFSTRNEVWRFYEGFRLFQLCDSGILGWSDQFRSSRRIEPVLKRTALSLNNVERYFNSKGLSREILRGFTQFYQSKSWIYSKPTFFDVKLD